MPIPTSDRVVGVFFDRESSYHPVATYAPQRVCAHKNCSAILSIYNDADKCALHKMPKHRSVRSHERMRAVKSVSADGVDGVNGVDGGE
jgi:hypothetical protein